MDPKCGACGGDAQYLLMEPDQGSDINPLCFHCLALFVLENCMKQGMAVEVEVRRESRPPRYCPEHDPNRSN